MDTAKLIELYKRPCFIFDDTARVKIEDDEIIDLDSISLDSNEDTWLVSNSRGSGCGELDKVEMKSRLDSLSVDGSGDFSRIELSNWDFREETLSESLLNLMNTTTTKKVEIDVVDVSSENLTSAQNTRVRDENSIPIDCNTFKKPVPKNELLEKVDNLRTSPSRIVEQEKNYAELNGTAKRKISVNRTLPLCHSTPLPMLRKHLNRIENEDHLSLKSHVESETIDTSLLPSSSSSSAEDLHSASEPVPAVETTVDVLENTLKDSQAFEMLDDSKSSSSSDSRRSSSTSIPRTVFLSKPYSSPSSSNRRLDLAPPTRTNVYSPPRTISSPSKSIYSSPRGRSVKKTLYTENKTKEPPRRAPSLSRLQAPASVNIHEEFVSVVEIKSKDPPAKIEKKPLANGPVSHLPRPSTRIPVFRTSVSCTRPTTKK